MVHAYVQLTIDNPAKFEAYRAKAGEALAKYGAEVLQSSRDLSALDGAPRLAQVGVILAFRDTATALGWINDPDLAETHQLRREAGRCDITLLG